MTNKGAYTGYFVTDSEKLLGHIPPRIQGEGVRLRAHHVTREFEPASGAESVTPGKRRVVMAIGQVVADGVHVVIVHSPDGAALSTNEYPHITIATAAGVPPVTSNEVIKNAAEAGTIEPIEPPIPVETVEGYFDGTTLHKGD